MLKILAPILAVPVHAYICRQRDRLLSRAAPLRHRDRTVLEGYFTADVLDSVRLLRADPLPIPAPPFASVMHRLRLDLPSPSMAEAITFDNVIACRDLYTASLLFHEVVHVLQYRLLGIEQFACQYVAGFLETRSYFEIPLERSAFDLQSRFETDAGPFGPEIEIRRHLRRG